jgi:hypothetical protein
MSREATIAKPLRKFAAIRTRLSNKSLSLTPCFCAGKVSGQLLGDASGVDGHTPLGLLHAVILGLLQVGDVDAEMLLESKAGIPDFSNGNTGELIVFSFCFDKGVFVDGASCGPHCNLYRSASRKSELIAQNRSLMPT